MFFCAAGRGEDGRSTSTTNPKKELSGVWAAGQPMCVYVYVYVCMCMCACVSIRMCVCVSVCACVSVHMCMCMCVYLL